MGQASQDTGKQGLVVRAPGSALVDEVLTKDARGFLEGLHRAFDARRRELLQRRQAVQARLDAGERLAFLPETANVRAAEWRVAPLAPGLVDRRVEITGPTDAKMVINALNSGANVFMADFEDACSPTFENLLEGQKNLREAVWGTLTFESKETGKRYALNRKVATLLVRPRGWHLPELHVLVDGQPMSGSLFDFGLFFFHNAKAQLHSGLGPYFYLPKMESHLEARLWNDVFIHAQKALGIPVGSIRATVLIETLPAAFEMEEILFELKEHSSGLNCGRWDYIFSFIKKRQADASAVLPDRSQVTMDKGFLRAYSQLLIQVCHRRGAHAMGGMAAQIPIKGDESANAEALAKVRADKLREVTDGHDGTWVAHPGLVPVAKAIFDEHMKGEHQLSRLRTDVAVDAEALLRVPHGTRTEAGLRHNVRVGVRYLEAWLNGLGCVPLYHLMEDAATAEISRAQVWQWLHHGAALEDGRQVTRALFDAVVTEEMQVIHREVGDQRFKSGRFDRARTLFVELATAPHFQDFLTLPAYEALVAGEANPSSRST
jgi:malate synthase